MPLQPMRPARARGMISWAIERAAAIALVPLTLWFIASLVGRMGDDYSTIIVWIKAPFVALLMVLLLIVAFSHLALGLQVVIEDYVGSRARNALLWVARAFCFVFAMA